MSTIVDDLANSVRTAVTDAATTGLTAFGGAAVLALGAMVKSEFIGGHATVGGNTLAQTLVTAFATDLCGCVATDIDTNGLIVGDDRTPAAAIKSTNATPATT